MNAKALKKAQRHYYHHNMHMKNFAVPLDKIRQTGRNKLYVK